MKVVYGNIYFACEAANEIPSHIRQVYEKALERLHLGFRHNVVKVAKDLQSVTLLWYPHLDTYAHPYLKESLMIPLDKSLPIKKIESTENPVILHRLETMLSINNPRKKFLTRLTAKEEEIGMFSKQHRSFIGRRRYWNALCRELNATESLSPEDNSKYAQSSLFDSDSPQKVRETITKVASQRIVKREATAMSTSRPSAPTQWAFHKGLISPVVVDWGCGKGRDSKWLDSFNIDVISYDPFYKPEPNPRNIDFRKVNTVLLIYVLNIIETMEDRRKVLEEIYNLAKPGTIVIISTRSRREIERNARRSCWKKLNDGYLTGKNTFQKGFTLEELSSFCSPYGRLIESNKLQGGIVCVISITK